MFDYTKIIKNLVDVVSLDFIIVFKTKIVNLSIIFNNIIIQNKLESIFYLPVTTDRQNVFDEHLSQNLKNFIFSISIDFFEFLINLTVSILNLIEISNTVQLIITIKLLITLTAIAFFIFY
jgi:hypothetical protein